MGLADYEILEQIGKGRYGTVYRALDIEGKREVAIKKGLNMDQEIKNHLALNGLHSVPELYDYFKESDKQGKVYTYSVQQLIRGDGLHKTWQQNKNWDFIWMTIYHALILIKEFHDHGYYHGDLHPNNLIWTGDRMYLIDFATVGNINDKLRQIETLSYQEALDLKYELQDKLCTDYKLVFSSGNLSRLRNYHRYQNIHYGYDRYEMLTDFIHHFPCEHIDYSSNIYITHNQYIDRVLQEYQHIDNLEFSSTNLTIDDE